MHFPKRDLVDQPLLMFVDSQCILNWICCSARESSSALQRARFVLEAISQREFVRNAEGRDLRKLSV